MWGKTLPHQQFILRNNVPFYNFKFLCQLRHFWVDGIGVPRALCCQSLRLFDISELFGINSVLRNRKQYVFECIITFADILQNCQLLGVRTSLQCFLAEDSHIICRSLGNYATEAVHNYANLISIQHLCHISVNRAINKNSITERRPNCTKIAMN